MKLDFIILAVHLEVCESLSQTFPSLQKKSREESEGEGSGVEILENRPYTDGPGGSGQYTHKVYHIGQHIPSWFRSILPKAALRVEEESWNAYPYTRTRWVCYLLIIKPSGSLSEVLQLIPTSAFYIQVRPCCFDLGVNMDSK